MSFAGHVITLFPELFPGPLGASLAGRALEAGTWSLSVSDLRTFGEGRHRAVDDTPAGGGPGMVLRVDVLAAALDAVQTPGDRRPVYALSPRGARFDQATARDLAAGPGVILICGRFEGIDERLFAARDVRELSLGDYVLSGGEIAAMAVLDACVRLLPGVMGAEASASEESFETGLLEYPHYTRPLDFEGHTIPEVLRSGDHARIRDWRRAQALKLTRARRPDLASAETETSIPSAEPCTTRRTAISERAEG